MATNESDLNVNINGKDNLTPSLNRSLSTIIRYVGAVSSALAALDIASFPVKSIRDFQRQLADVQKTTNFTSTELNQLGDNLVKLSTRIDISATDLAKIAAAAGQMGLGRDGVAGVTAFTESVSRMSSVLDIAVEDAGMAVGKLASIFHVPLQQTEALSSTFNQVSNNSTATGAQLIDVAKRVGDAAGAFKTYADAVGFAATAIDLGTSPEVAGTSLTKIFADMQGKAEKFAQFMGTSTEEWTNRVQENGVAAFKDYLAKLRTLRGDSQQAAIRELSGTGRIGALLTKFVNDTSNAILDRNLKNAYDGMRSGTSALKEQANIINTIDFRAKLAANSFRDLGIAAGDQFAKPLTGMLIEIGEALQNTSVISFAESVGKTFLDLFQTIQSGVKYLASLNVNWENFITLAKALAALKFAGWIGDAIFRLPLLNKALQSIANDANNATKALKGTEAAAVDLGEGATMVNGARLATTQARPQTQGLVARVVANSPELTRMKELREESQKYNDALKAQKVAEAELSVVENARAAQLDKQKQAYEAKISGLESLAPQAKAVSAAQAAILAAQQEGQAAIATAQATLNTKLEEAEAAHQQRTLAIEEEYANRRRAMRGHASANRIAELKEEEANLLAQEETYYARSLRGTQQYYERQLAMAEQAAVARNAAAAQALTQTQVGYGTAAAGAGVTVAAAEYATATAQVNRLNKEVDAAKDKLAQTSQEVAAAEKGFSKLGNALGFVKAGFSLLLSVLGKAFFWGTIIFTIADMLGLVDKLTALFPKFTDAIGLTSESQRKLAQETKDANDALEKQRKLIEDQNNKYRDMTDSLTHLLKPEDIKAWNEMLAGPTSTINSAQKALTEIMTAARGTMNIIQSGADKLDLLPYNRQEKEIELAGMVMDYNAALDKMNAARKKLSNQQIYQIDNPNDVNSIAAYVTPAMRQYARAKIEVDDLRKQMGALENQAAAIGPALEKALHAGVGKAETDFKTLSGIISKLFTDQSAEMFVKTSKDLNDLLDQRAAALEKLHKLQSEQGKQTADTPAQEVTATANAIAETTTQIETLNGQIFDTTDQAIKRLQELKKEPGLSPETLASFDNLILLLKQSSEFARTLVQSLGLMKGMHIDLTGGLKLPTTPPGKGEGTYEKESDRVGKARIALLKAQAQAEAALVKQAGEERLHELEHTNSQGLLAIKDFYKQKLAIELQDNEEAIRIAQIERDGIAKEMATQQKEAAKIQSQAALARVDGQIALLTQKRGILAKQNARDEEDAFRTFRDRLADESLKVSQLLGSSTDPQLFHQSLQVYQDQYRVFINQLKAESKDKPQLLPLIDAVEQSLKLRALGDTIDYITKKTEVATAHFDEFANQMTAMQQAGVITSQQAAKAIEAARAAQARFYQDGYEKAKVALSSQKEGTQAWLDTANRVDELRTKMLQAQADAVATAKGINDGITSSLADAIGNWTGSLSSFKDVAISFLTDVAKQIKTTFSKEAAENLMHALGSSGGGGIGGFISSFLGKGAPTPGSSANNPIFAFITNPNLALDGGGGAFSGIATDIGKWAASGSKIALGSGGDLATNSLDGVVETFSSKLGDTTNGIIDTMSGLFGGLGKGLMSVFQGLFSGLPGGGLGAFLAGLFHTGGVVGYGGGMQRMVPLGAFAGAARHHNGGFAGLQPDEVPTVLKRGEEILTTDDPRHRANGGGGKGGDQVTNVWVISPDQQPSMGPNDVIVTVADNISRSGSLKKLIQTIRR